MSKKNPDTATALAVPTKLSPAGVVGMSTKMKMDESLLPEEFKGVELEVIETGFDPTVKWIKPGNYVAGIFEKMEEGVGPNKSNLYSFDAKGRKFGVWGTTVLDRAISKAIAEGQLAFGHMVMITYVGDVAADPNPCKIFHIAVARKK